jgi:hypothetical protein
MFTATKYCFISNLCCVSIFGILINGWSFTDGYIAAIRNLGLAGFQLALYMLSCKNL